MVTQVQWKKTINEEGGFTQQLRVLGGEERRGRSVCAVELFRVKEFKRPGILMQGSGGTPWGPGCGLICNSMVPLIENFGVYLK